ncbi:MAG TPA: cytochrome b [Pseudomonadales bacterium]|nr:cytochrome b [Pseudomonadales bacterium]
MAFKSTPYRYGLVAQVLHWCVALLFAVQYVSVYYRHWFTTKGTSENDLALQVHLAFGLTVVLFVVPRLVWSRFDETPGPVDSHRWEHLAARLVHWALYFFMITMPISGYLYSSKEVHLLAIPRFGDTSLWHWMAHTWGLHLKEDVRNPMRIFHREIAGALVLWMLIALHVVAALYHHYVRRDVTLTRMLPGRSPGAAVASPNSRTS